MPPEPVFQTFDAGWVLLIVVAAGVLAYAFAWLAGRIEPFDVDLDEEPDWDVEPRRRDLEDDARRNPF